MKTIHAVILFSALSVLNSPAHAGFWDSITGFFGDSDDSSQASTAAVEAPQQASSSLTSTGLSLLPMLTQSLGVNDGQAQGGMGALLQAVKLLMPQNDFSTIAQAIPNASSLLSAAPALTGGGSGGMMDTAMQMAGEKSTTAKAGLDLVSQFKSLGMGADMIPKFSNVAEGYLTQNDAPEASSLLSSTLSSLL